MKEDEKIVFMVTADESTSGAPLVVLGIPEAAWLQLKAGKIQHFDLTRIGMDFKLVICGGDSHQEITEDLTAELQAKGAVVLDYRRKKVTL